MGSRWVVSLNIHNRSILQDRVMTKRIYNFSAGPAVLPESVIEEAKANMLSLGDTGVGVMEHSHRGAALTEHSADSLPTFPTIITSCSCKVARPHNSR